MAPPVVLASPSAAKVSEICRMNEMENDVEALKGPDELEAAGVTVVMAMK